MTSPATHRCASRPWTIPAAPHLGRLDLDARLVIRCFDAGFAALAGERAHDLLGRPLDVLFAGDAPRLGELVERGGASRLDLTLVLRLGARETPSRLQLAPTDVGWLAVIEDLGAVDSRVAELVTGRELWREVVDRSRDGVAVLAGDGRLLEHNPAFLRLLDLPGDAPLRGQLLVDLLRDEELAPLRDHLDGRAALPHQLHHRGRWLALAAHPLALPRRRSPGAWLSLRDISDRHRADDLSRALEDARAELRRKDRLAALGGLVEGLARELGAPLSAAAAAAGLAQDQLRELQAAFEAGILRQRDMRHHLGRALSAGDAALADLRRAAALVAGVEQLRIGGVRPARIHLSVGTYVSTVVAGLDLPDHGAHPRVHVDIRADPVVPLFPAALAQIVANLVHDALSRTPGRAGTAAIWVDQVGDQIELGCRDDASTQPPAGSLNLHIVHTLVTDILGGTMVTRAAPDRGAVVIRFPARPS